MGSAPAAYCHCTECRKCTGSPFNVSVGVARTHFQITAGSPKGFTKTSEIGNELTRHFCPDCGSPLYTSSPRHPDRIYIQAGVFDDPGLIEPAYQSWTRSAVPWAMIKASVRSEVALDEFLSRLQFISSSLATAPAAPDSTLSGGAPASPETSPAANRPLDEEEKVLAGSADANMPALLTRDVPGG